MRWSALVASIVGCAASLVATRVAHTFLHTPAAAVPLPVAFDMPPAQRPEMSADDGAPEGAESVDETGASVAAPQTPYAPAERASPVGFRSALPTSESVALFADAGRARRVGAVPKAIALYELLQHRYPGTPESRAADMALALLLTRQGAYDTALQHFDRYLQHSPQGDLAAEAMWGKAQALTSLGRDGDAYRTLHRLQLLHPRSSYAIEARTRLQMDAPVLE